MISIEDRLRILELLKKASKEWKVTDHPGCGLELRAKVDTSLDFKEYKTKPDCYLPVMRTEALKTQFVEIKHAYAPWTRFNPQEYDALMRSNFELFVLLMNHAEELVTSFGTGAA